MKRTCIGCGSKVTDWSYYEPHDRWQGGAVVCRSCGSERTKVKDWVPKFLYKLAKLPIPKQAPVPKPARGLLPQTPRRPDPTAVRSGEFAVVRGEF